MYSALKDQGEQISLYTIGYADLPVNHLSTATVMTDKTINAYQSIPFDPFSPPAKIACAFPSLPSPLGR